MKTAKEVLARWHKDCLCDATSSRGALRYEEIPHPDAGNPHAGFAWRWAFYPMPSCDKCGKPWAAAEGRGE